MTIGGLQVLFGAALGPLFSDAVLHKATLMDNGAGGLTAASTDLPCKAVVQEFSEKDRVASGLPADAVTLIVLRAGLSAGVAVDDSLTVDGRTYRVLTVATEAGQVSDTVTGVAA